MVRVVRSHRAKIAQPAVIPTLQRWAMSEQDALDILTTASLVHRKLDKARRVR